jgi:hypothetical protein
MQPYIILITQHRDSTLIHMQVGISNVHTRMIKRIVLQSVTASINIFGILRRYLSQTSSKF